MAKYIEVDDFLDAIYPVDPENDGSDGCTVVAMPLTLTSEELEVMLDKIPAANVAPVVHAHWIEQEDICGDTYYTCSNCKCDWTTIDGTPEQNNMKYCPECGAKMDGKGE